MKLPRLPSAYLAWLPLILMGVVGILALTVCVSAGVAWQRVHGEMAEQQALFVRYRRLVDQQPAIDATGKIYAGYLAVDASEDEALHHLLTMIEQLASHHGVQIMDLKPRPLQRSAEAIEYAVELQCNATIEALAQFIHALEYSQALLRVDRLRINPALRTPQSLQSELLITYTNVL